LEGLALFECGDLPGDFVGGGLLEVFDGVHVFDLGAGAPGGGRGGGRRRRGRRRRCGIIFCIALLFSGGDIMYRPY
jgi:hypothetical protein